MHPAPGAGAGPGTGPGEPDPEADPVDDVGAPRDLPRDAAGSPLHLGAPRPVAVLKLHGDPQMGFLVAWRVDPPTSSAWTLIVNTLEWDPGPT